MSDIKELQNQNKFLKDKLILLQAKLKVCENWMAREVKESVKKISQKKVNKMTCDTRQSFMQENIEEIITKKIRDFFWDFILMNTPASVIDNIVSWEINYYNLRQNPNFDGFSVISSYHKAIDTIIESFIIKWFRKFSKKNNQTQLRKNDPLEKTLNSVVNKWFILSTWRLLHLIKNISEEKELFDYGKVFKKYLEKYDYLWNILLSPEFIKKYDELISTETLWKKRHSGKINFLDTRKSRNLIIWDFKDKGSIIYMLLKTQEIDF